ncbi:MAG: hypothetical protein WCW01_02150 [Gammaproteobacteria bacterium]
MPKPKTTTASSTTTTASAPAPAPSPAQSKTDPIEEDFVLVDGTGVSAAKREGGGSSSTTREQITTPATPAPPVSVASTRRPTSPRRAKSPEPTRASGSASAVQPPVVSQAQPSMSTSSFSFGSLPTPATSATISPLSAPSQIKFDATLIPGFDSYVADLRESKFKKDFADLVLQIAGSDDNVIGFDGFSRFVVAKQPGSNVPQTAAELLKSTFGAGNYELLLSRYDPDLLNKSEREEQARLPEGDRFLAKKQINLFRRKDGKVGLNVHYYDLMYEHAGKIQRKPGYKDDEYVLEQDGFKPVISETAQGYDPKLTMTNRDLKNRKFSKKSPLGILREAEWVSGSRVPESIGGSGVSESISGSSVTSFMLDINRGILVNSGSCTSDINLTLLRGKAMSQEEAAKAVLGERLGTYVDKKQQVETFKAINDYYHQGLMGGEIKSQLTMMAAKSPIGCNYLVTSVKGLTPQLANNLSWVSQTFSEVTYPAMVKSVDAEGKFQAAYYYDPIGKFLVPLPTITEKNFPKLKSLSASLADTELPERVHDAISEALQPYSTLKNDDHSANLYRDAAGNIVLEGEFANPIYQKLESSWLPSYSVKIPGRIRTKYVLDPKQGFKLVSVEFSDLFMRRWFLGELTQKDWQELATRAQEEARLSATQSISASIVSSTTTRPPLPSSVATSSSSSATTKPTGGRGRVHPVTPSISAVPAASAAVTSKPVSTTKPTGNTAGFSFSALPASSAPLAATTTAASSSVTALPATTKPTGRPGLVYTVTLPPINAAPAASVAVTSKPASATKPLGNTAGFSFSALPVPSAPLAATLRAVSVEVEDPESTQTLWKDFIRGSLLIVGLDKEKFKEDKEKPEVPPRFIKALNTALKSENIYTHLKTHYQQDTIFGKVVGIMQDNVPKNDSGLMVMDFGNRQQIMSKAKGLDRIFIDITFDSITLTTTNLEILNVRYPGRARFVLNTIHPELGFRLEGFDLPPISEATLRQSASPAASTTTTTSPTAPATTSKPVTMGDGSSSSSTGRMLHVLAPEAALQKAEAVANRLDGVLGVTPASTSVAQGKGLQGKQPPEPPVTTVQASSSTVGSPK